jgi:hypothetical protein
MALFGFSLLPLWTVAQTYWMKAQLHRGIAYVLTPDLRQPQEFGAGAGMVNQGLNWLEDLRSGIYYPILSNLRSQILFNGLVLPDAKSDRLSLAFSGAVRERNGGGDAGFLSFFGGQSRARGAWVAPRVPALPEATLEGIKSWQIQQSDGTTITRIQLEMQGGPEGQSEFKRSIRLPEGMWVCGFALYLGEDRIEGRLFEEKSALWVYRMIRDADRESRLRDPATLTCEADGSLRLQVFPLDPGQRRFCELDVLGLGQGGTLWVGDRSVSLAADADFLQSAAVVGSGGAFGVLQKGSAEHAFIREPYLHLFIDRSLRGLSDVQVLARMEQLRTAYPEVQLLRVTLVNLETREVGDGWVPWDEAVARLWEGLADFKCRGGCLAGQAITRAAFAAVQASDPEAWLRRPVFVVMGAEPMAVQLPASGSRGEWVSQSNSTDLLDFDKDLWAPFKRLLPDVADPLILRGEAVVPQPASAPVPVNLYRSGGGFALGRPDSLCWLRFFDVNAGDSLQRYAPEDGSWQPMEVVHGLPERLHAAANLDLDSFASQMNPAVWSADLKQMVARSKEHRLLTPATAFIVVENSAQWKVLEMKEAQKLGGPAVLDFDETPEPSVWLLAALWVAWMLLRQIRLRRS